MGKRHNGGKDPHVRIAAHVAGDDTKDLHGERGTVIGARGGQYQKNDGERMVSVKLDDGRIVGVPERALDRG
jgi:hypothetical protein